MIEGTSRTSPPWPRCTLPSLISASPLPSPLARITLHQYSQRRPPRPRSPHRSPHRPFKLIDHQIRQLLSRRLNQCGQRSHRCRSPHPASGLQRWAFDLAPPVHPQVRRRLQVQRQVGSPVAGRRRDPGTPTRASGSRETVSTFKSTRLSTLYILRTVYILRSLAYANTYTIETSVEYFAHDSK